jgi:hypothetical protein
MQAELRILNFLVVNWIPREDAQFLIENVRTVEMINLRINKI